jgi:hypothetical protein
MRVGDSGSGPGFGGGQGPRDRAATFRRAHQVGQRLSGRILSCEAPGLYWVDLSGHTLLASMDDDARPGETRIFEVQSLEPELRLRQLPGQRSGLPPALGRLAAFQRRRAACEAAAGPLLERLAREPDFAARQAALEQDPDCGPLLATAQDAAAELGQALGLAGAARAGYAPWVLPQARNSEYLWRGGSDNLLELVFSLSLPGRGAAEARLLARSQGPAASASCWLHLESAPDAELLRDLPAALARLAGLPAGPAPELLGVRPLRPEQRGGALAQALAAQTGALARGGLA